MLFLRKNGGYKIYYCEVSLQNQTEISAFLDGNVVKVIDIGGFRYGGMNQRDYTCP